MHLVVSNIIYVLVFLRLPICSYYMRLICNAHLPLAVTALSLSRVLPLIRCLGIGVCALSLLTYDRDRLGSQRPSIAHVNEQTCARRKDNAQKHLTYNSAKDSAAIRSINLKWVWWISSWVIFDSSLRTGYGTLNRE